MVRKPHITARDFTMNESEVASVAEHVHWVGVDVAKKAFDAALVARVKNFL